MMKMAITETTLTSRTWRARPRHLVVHLAQVHCDVDHPRTFCDSGWAWHAAEEQSASLYMGLMIPRTRWLAPCASSLSLGKKMRLRSDVASRSSGALPNGTRSTLPLSD